MNRLGFIGTLCVIFIPALLAEQEDPFISKDLASLAIESGDLVKEVIGDDWSVEVKDRTIIIESKFNIYRVLTISRPFGSPPQIDAPVEHLLKEAAPEKYVIRLRFENSLERQELMRRRSERQAHADVLNFGARSKIALSEAAEAYSEIQVPRYHQNSYQIYRNLSEAPGRQVYPLSALTKVGAAKQILDTIFRPLLTGND